MRFRLFFKQLKKQNEQALVYIIEHYSALVQAISYKILSSISKDSVEECVNDVFLTVWQNANIFKGEQDDFKKWIAMITKYKAIDRFRSLERLHAHEDGADSLHFQENAENVEMKVMKKEERNELLLAICSRTKDDGPCYHYVKIGRLAKNRWRLPTIFSCDSRRFYATFYKRRFRHQ